MCAVLSSFVDCVCDSMFIRVFHKGQVLIATVCVQCIWQCVGDHWGITGDLWPHTVKYWPYLSYSVARQISRSLFYSLLVMSFVRDSLTMEWEVSYPHTLLTHSPHLHCSCPGVVSVHSAEVYRGFLHCYIPCFHHVVLPSTPGRGRHIRLMSREICVRILLID